jgi:hypothetical protein
MSALAMQAALVPTALEHAHRVIMAPTKQNLGLLHVLPARPASFRRCWVLRRMCVLAMLERRDPTGIRRVHRVILALTNQKQDLLHVSYVEQGNLRQ